MPAKPRSFSASPEGLIRLNAAKARLGLTNAAIAEQAGVNVGTVGQLWQGQQVSVANVIAIANVLKLSIEELISTGGGLAEARRRIQKAVVTKATTLYLSSLHLTAVPAELGQLVNLTKLYLFDNYLTAVPAELGQLVNLTTLYFSNNQLTAVPVELGQLVNLTTLYFSNNQLTAVPAELGQLINLTELYLSNNQLTAVPAGLGQLVNLTRLDLSDNQLTAVPEFIRFVRNLEEVNLGANQITALPEFLKQISTLKRLFLHDNPKLGIPDEILGCTSSDFIRRSATPAKPQDILNYYFRIQYAPKPLNEAKLILVGYGNVGKTSLVNRIIHSKFDPDSRKTEGIQITDWNLRLNGTEDIKLNRVVGE